MPDFPYTSVVGKLKTFLDKIPDTGVPSKVTQQELSARGFKSTNDRTIIGVLKAVSLIGPDGSPTANWQSYRNRATNRALMAHLVREAYADLFSVYPDADKRSDAEIKNLMGSKTKAGERAVQYMVQTFKCLAGLGDFQAEPPEAGAEPSTSVSTTSVRRPAQKEPTAQIHVNLQIHLSDMDNEDKIDAVFKSMAAHIFGRPIDE